MVHACNPSTQGLRLKDRLRGRAGQDSGREQEAEIETHRDRDAERERERERERKRKTKVHRVVRLEAGGGLHGAGYGRILGRSVLNRIMASQRCPHSWNL
jgi:hypothetical protein